MRVQYRRWGGRKEVPPPLANLQASRGAKRRRISWQEEPGGGWRCAGAVGEFLECAAVFQGDRV